MLMVIFGAGASYDSVPAHPPNIGPYLENRPPLANQLFANRPQFAAALAEFPECHAVVPWLREPKGAPLEGMLQRLQDEAQDYPERYSQLAAVRYYLQQMLWRCEQHWKDSAMGITNYKSLFDMIEQWRQARDESVCIVTFNYDTLLEDALPIAGLRIGVISDYISRHPRYVVVKLHGSLNWSREVDFPTDFRTQDGPVGVRRQLINRAAQLIVSNRYVQEDPYTIGIYKGRIVFPAIAIPVERKSQFECPSEHLDALRSSLPKVRKVLVIGWRGMEEHFLKLLSEHLQAPVEMMMVDGSVYGASEAKNRLVQVFGSRISGEIQSTTDGFTAFVLNRRAIPFLRSEPSGGSAPLHLD